MCSLRGQFRRAKLSAVDGLGGGPYIYSATNSPEGGATFRGGTN